MDVKDSNGNLLQDGDSVLVIKDLKVKGSSLVLKRGKTFKNIRLTGSSEEVECREGKATLVLKTCFLKKA
ncbi:MAG: alkylphosphonate utilization protein [Rhabdochlamydiaceae bacterium]|nr:alkylphosphonate utilization protein [Rhabdochlamydiaceae bacterium]